MFDTPIKVIKVRNGVFANVYSNGIICIRGQRYVGWTIAQAISKYRKKFPARNK